MSIPRCPYCLTQMEVAPDIGHNGPDYFDCESCHIRVKIWAYSPGDGSWSFMRYLRSTDPNKTYIEEVKR